jgi:hypothetical protein
VPKRYSKKLYSNTKFFLQLQYSIVDFINTKKHVLIMHTVCLSRDQMESSSEFALSMLYSDCCRSSCLWPLYSIWPPNYGSQLPTCHWHACATLVWDCIVAAFRKDIKILLLCLRNYANYGLLRRKKKLYVWVHREIYSLGL